MIKQSPLTNQAFSFDPRMHEDIDIEVHTGDNTRDQKDRFSLTGKNPLMNGVSNRFQMTRAGREGLRFNGVTARGMNSSTHTQVQRREFITFERD